MRKWEKTSPKIVQFRKLTRISIDYYLRMRQTLYALGTIFFNGRFYAKILLETSLLSKRCFAR